MANKAELIITALQQRIGELVSNYETQIAILRAELTEMSNRSDAEQEYRDGLLQKMSDVEE